MSSWGGRGVLVRDANNPQGREPGRGRGQREGGWGVVRVRCGCGDGVVGSRGGFMVCCLRALWQRRSHA